MPVSFRRPGGKNTSVSQGPTPAATQAPAVQETATQEQMPLDAEWKAVSPFKHSAHASVKPKPAPLPATTSAPKVSPNVAAGLGGKKILRVGGGRTLSSSVSSTSTPHEVMMKAVGLGLVTKPIDQWAESRARWPDVEIDSKVKITNSLFPWVRHYAPGDVAVVEAIAMGLPGEDPIKYRNHALRLITGENKGGTLMLFRWEFEPIPEDPTPVAKGRIVSGT